MTSRNRHQRTDSALAGQSPRGRDGHSEVGTPGPRIGAAARLLLLAGAAGALGIGALVAVDRTTPLLQGAGEEALLGGVAVGTGLALAVLCLYLVCVWLLAGAILLLGPRSRAARTPLRVLRVLAPSLARRLLSGAVILSAASGIALSPATAASIPSPPPGIGDRVTTSSAPAALDASLAVVTEGVGTPRIAGAARVAIADRADHVSTTHDGTLDADDTGTAGGDAAIRATATVLPALAPVDDETTPAPDGDDTTPTSAEQGTASRRAENAPSTVPETNRPATNSAATEDPTTSGTGADVPTTGSAGADGSGVDGSGPGGDTTAPLPPLGWGEQDTPLSSADRETAPPAIGPSANGTTGTDQTESAPQETAPPLPASPIAPTSPGVVTVGDGDCLWSITDDLLGPGIDDPARIDALWPLLYQANRDRIGDDPDLVATGEQLVIPPELLGAGAPAASTPLASNTQETS